MRGLSSKILAFSADRPFAEVLTLNDEALAKATRISGQSCRLLSTNQLVRNGRSSETIFLRGGL